MLQILALLNLKVRMFKNMFLTLNLIRIGKIFHLKPFQAEQSIFLLEQSLLISYWNSIKSVHKGQ